MMASGRGLAVSLAFVLGFSVLTSLSSSTTPNYTSCPSPCRCSGVEDLGGNTRIMVNCSGVDLSKFPVDLPSSVRLLDLSLNRIDTLPTPGSLAHLENLETLILRGNSYEGPVGPKAFLGLSSLKMIDLSYNSITSLHNESFYGCDKLLTLDLTGNRGITDIPFINSSVKTMLLDHCGIAEPGMKPLSSSLTKLYLRGNPLSEMPSIAGQNLQILNVRSCSLSVVHRNSLYRMPFLTNLDVSKNPRLISLVHVRSESLRVIDAEDCSLGSNELKVSKRSEIAFAPLASMSGLTHANLAGNRIKSIGQSSFSHNGNLVHLDLSRNGLELITGNSLTRLGKLQAVNLSFNAIKSLDEVTFSANHFLEVLDLSHNEHLTHLPALDAASLRRLLASRCDISGIGIKGEGNPFTHMPNLEYLDLSRNPLESLPKDLSSQGLKDLDLSFCRISVVETRTLKGLSHLTRLDLRGNRIASLDPDAVRGLEFLAISDNPWKCDCDNPRFQQLWKVMDKMQPQDQPLHCAPSDEDQKKAKAREAVPPGESLKLWQDVCSRSSSSTVPVPASSMWSFSVALVLAVAAFVVGVVVFRHWVKEKKVRREAAEAAERASNRRRCRRRRRGARRETSDEDEDGGEVEREPSRDVVMVRRLMVESLPPSYEEAVLMPRPEEVEVRLEVEPATAGEAEEESAEQGAVDTARDEVEASSSSLPEIHEVCPPDPIPHRIM